MNSEGMSAGAIADIQSIGLTHVDKRIREAGLLRCR
jgi:hypothetical protein